MLNLSNIILIFSPRLQKLLVAAECSLMELRFSMNIEALFCVLVGEK